MSLAAIFRCVCASALAVLQCAWAQPTATAENAAVFALTAPTGALFSPLDALPSTRARVVFYREASGGEQGVKPGVVSLFLNGKYFASLQSGAYNHICFMPGQVEVAARSVENGVTPEQAFDVVNTLILRGGQEVFVKVKRDASKPAAMVVMTPAQAQAEVVQTRAQRHTLSRVTVSCDDPSAPALAKPIPEAPLPVTAPVRRLTLSADALFEFGKSDVANIPPKGRRLLDHVVDRLKSEFGAGRQVEIRIFGHADKFGSDAKNLRISQERAQAVKAYLVKSGLVEKNIFTEGRGHKEPVVTRCGELFNKANVLCTQPNRRVELEVRSK